jgi:predicted KAP-like P-loop ATPase
MEKSSGTQIDRQEAVELSLAVGKAFQPRAPISAREFFAGRWEQITTLVDAVAQSGLHIVIFGERGVGKTSLANIIDPLLAVMDEGLPDKPANRPPRLVVKVNTHSKDTFSDVWNRVFEEISWTENKPVIGIKPPSNSRHA